MLSKTVTIDGVSFTAHTETGRHVFILRALARKLKDELDGADREAWAEFLRAVAQSTDVVVPFAWPSAASSYDELVEAQAQWLALPGNTIIMWLSALNDVDLPPAEVELTPAADPKNA